MANSMQAMIRPWFLDVVPLVVVLLIIAHVLALVGISISRYQIEFDRIFFVLTYAVLFAWIRAGLLDLQISN